MKDHIQRVGCLFLALCSTVLAQPSEDVVPQPADEQPRVVTIVEMLDAIGQAEPVRRAGLRAGLIRQTQRVIPAVVIVRDAKSYLQAISSWEGPVRFPILWDDGSARSHEDIARFVRAFEPEEVLRYTGDDPGKLTGTREERGEAMERALGRAFTDHASGWEPAFDALRKQGVFSPGIVVADPDDTGWAAAIALSAGRIEPIVMMNLARPAVKDLTPEQGDQMEVAIERAVEAMGFEWKEIGDEIDAITLAMNTGTRIDTGAKARDSVATTDRIGRSGAGGAGTRWAYTGQLLGNTSACLYQAMCALFLEIDSAFLWDGYNNKEPWSSYDMTKASQQLTEFGIESELHDQPGYTLDYWRRRMVRPVDASLILVNSKGSRTRFDLPGGEGASGDFPILTKPAAIHIVHSFSMDMPTNKHTIGGRLLERGVYVYAGSVDEPYLSAFVPSPLIARRLGGSLNFAAAVRYDNAEVWKINVIGDPLVTVGSAGTRVEMPTMNDAFEDVRRSVKEMVKDGDFAGAISGLVMLGEDKDASRLGGALMKDRPEAFTSACARAVLPAMFRNGEHEAVIDAFERLDTKDREDLLMRDLLWFSGRVALRNGADPRVEAILRANYRPGQVIPDAEELAMFIRRRSIPDAVAVLESVRNTLSNDGQRKMLDRAIKRVRGS